MTAEQIKDIKCTVGKRRNTKFPELPQLSHPGFLPASGASDDGGSSGGGGGKGPEAAAPITGPTKLPAATSDPVDGAPEAATGSMAISPSPRFWILMVPCFSSS